MGISVSCEVQEISLDDLLAPSSLHFQDLTYLFLSDLFSDVTLCEEALFRFAVPEKLTPNWLNVLTDGLPGTKINAENIEMIKQKRSSQEQMFQLLKLWKQQNKEQDMVKKIIQGNSDSIANTFRSNFSNSTFVISWSQILPWVVGTLLTLMPMGTV